MGLYQSLAYVTYSPSEPILKKGTDASIIFFLRKGEVHTVSADKRKTHLYSIAEVGLVALSLARALTRFSHAHTHTHFPNFCTIRFHFFFHPQDGAYFGERCLLEPPMEEDVHYVAKSRCDFFCLPKAELLHLVAEHLVPAHRVQLAQDVFKEVVRKVEQHMSSLRLLSAEAAAMLQKDRKEEVVACHSALLSMTCFGCNSLAFRSPSWPLVCHPLVPCWHLLTRSIATVPDFCGVTTVCLRGRSTRSSRSSRRR